MDKEVIRPAGTGAPTVPLSPGIKANGFIFVSGQTGRNPATGEFPEGVEAQTRQTLENVRAVLEAGGSAMERVVKCTVFMTDIAEFATMNEVYRTYFSSDQFPARSTVQVAALARPGILVEIEAVALA